MTRVIVSTLYLNFLQYNKKVVSIILTIEWESGEQNSGVFFYILTIEWESGEQNSSVFFIFSP